MMVSDKIAALAARTWSALVHHPVYDRNHRVVTTAITNLDLHDIARSTRTFGLAGYLVVTPVAAQRELASRILGHWQGEGDPSTGLRAGETPRNEYRKDALDRVAVIASIDDAVAHVTAASGSAPLVVATAARDLRPERTLGYGELVERTAALGRPILLLFGTGWGLADEVVDRVDHLLTPIRGHTDYNHLSVRSAAAIVMDRLFGIRVSDGKGT